MEWLHTIVEVYARISFACTCAFNTEMETDSQFWQTFSCTDRVQTRCCEVSTCPALARRGLWMDGCAVGPWVCWPVRVQANTQDKTSQLHTENNSDKTDKKTDFYSGNLAIPAMFWSRWSVFNFRRTFSLPTIPHMQQNRSISLVLTLFDHFYFHPLAVLSCYH